MAPPIRFRGSGSRRLTFLLLVVLVPPAAALVWLGFELLAQDRTLLRQRQADRREAAAELMARNMTQALTETEGLFAVGALPHGTVRVRFNGTSLEVEPRSALAWIPETPVLPEYASAPFVAAEQDEYQNRGDRGRGRYVQASTAADPALRAGGLVRLARLSRVEGDVKAALDAYNRLSRIAEIAINGMPAELVARRMICELLHEAGQVADFTREADALASDFIRNKWFLDRAIWELTARDLRGWTGRAMAPADRLTMSASFERLISSAPGPRNSSSGRRAASAGGQTTTFAWRREGETLSVLAVTPRTLASWVAAVASREGHSGLSFGVFSEDGTLAAGVQPPATGSAPVHAVRRLPSETGLPWIIRVSGDTADAAAQLAARRRLLAAGLVALVLLLAGGSYIVLRVVRREIAVARLQTEFVAAVSHEFRTPLTSLRHVTELLQESDDLPHERRQAFYAVLAQNGDRLHRLVESVLDFAQMEEGRRPFQLRSVDIRAVLAQLVAEFGAGHSDRRVRLHVPPESGPVLADSEALGHALWNLLDNAIKYSPDGGDVVVRLDNVPEGIAISVTDQGLGVPAEERSAIFGRFVRGATATHLGIKGTGLGLALVMHIVNAHGGRVDVDSAEGRGSVFTIRLPVVAATARTPALSVPSPVHAKDSHR